MGLFRDTLTAGEPANQSPPPLTAGFLFVYGLGPCPCGHVTVEPPLRSIWVSLPRLNPHGRAKGARMPKHSLRPYLAG